MKMSYRGIKNRHKADSEMYLRVAQLHPMEIPQAHQDRAELLKLVDEAKLLIGDIRKSVYGGEDGIDEYNINISDIDKFLSKLD